MTVVVLIKEVEAILFAHAEMLLLFEKVLLSYFYINVAQWSKKCQYMFIIAIISGNKSSYNDSERLRDCSYSHINHKQRTKRGW